MYYLYDLQMNEIFCYDNLKVKVSYSFMYILKASLSVRMLLNESMNGPLIYLIQ